jgi:transposase
VASTRARKPAAASGHIAVDALGLLLTVLVTTAAVQDRDAARPLLWNLKRAYRTVKLTWADSGYAGKLITWAKTWLKLTLQIVERTFAWITRSRRTVRDYERLSEHHETMIYWSMIIVMSRRLAKLTQSQQPQPG